MPTRFRGEPLLVHAVRGLLRADCVDRALVMVPETASPEASEAIQAIADARIDVLPGGPTRVDAVRSALTDGNVAASDILLLHDAARSFVPPATIRSVVDTVRAGAVAAVPVEPVTDTVKVVDTGGAVRATLDRASLRSAQSPQAFLVGALRQIDLADLTDPLAVLGPRVRTVPGHPHGMRLTTQFDLTVMEALLADASEDLA